MEALPEAELGARDRRSCSVSAHEVMRRQTSMPLSTCGVISGEVTSR